MLGIVFKRHIRSSINATLADTPVVLLTGARQVGKSTLIRMVADDIGARYLSLDEDAVMSIAGSDPAGFIADLDTPVVIDEVQRAPELLRAIKQAVDDIRYEGNNSASGLFLLTGSTNIWTSLRVSESLAGRVERLPLWPLSQGELRGVRESFVDSLFKGKLPTVSGAGAGRSCISGALVQGGYPEAIKRDQPERRDYWYENYIGTVIERDVRDLSNIHELGEVPTLLRLVAGRIAGLLNLSSVARDLGIPRMTVARYLKLLEAVYLIQLIPAWRKNVGQRLIKSPKTWLTDSGLAAHLLGFDATRIERDDTGVPGSLFENFVGIELLKQSSWAETKVRFYHYRTAGGMEVDIVLENNSGDVCGVEVKLAATVTKKDFRGLEHLREKLGDRFQAGVIIYTGSESVPFGDRLWLAPVSALWAAQ